MNRVQDRGSQQSRRVAGARSVVLVAVASLSTCLITAGSAHADGRTDVRYDGDFIESLQRGDGSILADTSRLLVDPYLGGYSALGLARATRFSNDKQYLASAIRWLAWYQNHMDQAGVVHDYRVVNGNLVVTDDEDSVDATSGVFLGAVKEAYLANPPRLGRGMVHGLSRAIHAAVGAIESLQDSDGMTWAKPTWHVKYLMDNSEAYAGLLAARDLAGVLGDTSLVVRATLAAARAKAGLLTLWNPSTRAYDWALHASGYRQTTDWRNLYPDSVEQAWTVAYGVSDSSRSRDLMAALSQSQPSWDRPTTSATYWDGHPYPHAVDFWSVVGWAFRAVGNRKRAAAGAVHIRDGAWQINRQPPFTAGAQGELIVLESGA